VSGEPGSTEKWVAPAAEARKKNPVASNESSLAAEQKIYVKRCVACHGRRRLKFYSTARAAASISMISPQLVLLHQPEHLP
jgi:mono/diheme cytochrome c family protein